MRKIREESAKNLSPNSKRGQNRNGDPPRTVCPDMIPPRFPAFVRIHAQLFLVLVLSGWVVRQTCAFELPPPVKMSAQEDHALMMEKLGIQSIRRGANGRDPNAPNAANYLESKANHYPHLPDPLLTQAYTPVALSRTLPELHLLHFLLNGR